MRVLFFEPAHTGHHLAYLARLLPGFLSLPVEVVLATTPRAVDSEEFALTIKPLSDRLTVQPICRTPPSQQPLAVAKHNVIQFAQVVEQLKPDHAYVMYGDGFWQICTMQSLWRPSPLPDNVPVEAFLYRGGLAYPFEGSLQQRIKKCIDRLLFKKCLRKGLFSALHIDDELLHEFALNFTDDSGPTQIILTPNPVAVSEPMSKTEARQALGIASEGKIFSSLGMIDERKGAIVMLQAFAAFMKNAPADDARLLLAGPHHQHVRQMLGQQPWSDWVANQRIISFDKYINETELFRVAAASDVLNGCYQNHSGRSSVVLWAAAAGRPVLGTKRGCIGYVIEKEKLGLTCHAHDPREVAAHLSRAFQMPWNERDAARARRYVQFHSIENYQQSTSSLLRKRL